MKKIINNKVYDTDTAKFIGSGDNGLPRNDFRHYEEGLYLKKTGEYFLYGSGGPASKYSKETGQNSWSGSWMIIPLDFDAARDWAEDNLDADDYLELFEADPEDEGGSVRMTVYLPESLVDRLKLDASKAGETLSAHVQKKLS